MKIHVLLAVLILMIAAPAFAQRVGIDYDPEYDFDSIKTFQWKDSQAPAKNPLNHQRIVSAIDYQITMKGGLEVTENPDVYVTYYGSASEKTQVNTTSYGYGYPGGWYGGYYGRYYGGYGGVGISGSTSTVSTYDVGSLVVDVWDAKTEKLIWRGTAEATIPAKPQKVEKLIDKSLNKMFYEWEKRRNKDAKRKAKQEAAAAG